MIPFEWSQILIGMGVGAAISTLYFAGLAYGMRTALRTLSPIRILSMSAALRMAMLLGAGWIVTSQSGPWAFVGYGAAFFILRFVATTWARIGAKTEGSS